MSDPVIEARDLAKVYRIGELEVHALRGVSLTIERGEFVAIMGASGSGKSTLMNIFGCLDRPSSGRYLLEGVDVTGQDEPALAQVRSRRIGFVFQNFALFPHMTAFGNVEFPLRVRSVPGEERKRRVEASLRMVRLDQLAEGDAVITDQASGGNSSAPRSTRSPFRL